MTNEQAIDLLDNLIGFVEDNQNNDYDEAFKMAIEALSAQPERKTGRWKEEYDGNGWNDYWSFTCSECRTKFDKVDFRMAYCPNCGSYNGGGA